MLTTPILESKYTFHNIDNIKTVAFQTIGSDPHDTIEYVILDAGLDKIYEEKQKNTSNTITIPSNAISQYAEYKIKIRTISTTYQGIEITSEWSQLSDLIVYPLGIASIVNSTTSITTPTYTFNCIFAQNEYAIVKGFYYILYDNKNKILKRSSVTYSQTANVNLEVTGLEDGKSYKFAFIVIDEYDEEIPVYMTFSVTYEVPKIRQIVKATPNPCNASIEVSSKIYFLKFIAVGDWNYLNNEEIDLTRDGYIYMDKGFEIGLDFSLQLWGRNLIKDTEIIRLKEVDSDDYISVWYDSSDKLLKATKTFNNYVMNYRQVVPCDIENKNFTILIKQINGRLELKSMVI